MVMDRRIRATINRLAHRFSRWAEDLYPEHDWIADTEGLLYCRVCWLPYSHWSGDLCPDEERVNARLPEWRPPNPAPPNEKVDI